MLVCVTGGTGFVGAHSVAALTRIGHKVRILARTEAGVERALAPLRVDLSSVDVVVGDVTDEVAVARAMVGVGGVLHAAAVYSFDSRRADEMRATNVRGTDLVLAAARRDLRAERRLRFLGRRSADGNPPPLAVIAT